MIVCDGDCFNCKFPDCIGTPNKSSTDRVKKYLKTPKGMEARKRYLRSEKGMEIKKNSSQKRIKNGKNAEACRRYYQRHREEILQKKREARERESRKEAV